MSTKKRLEKIAKAIDLEDPQTRAAIAAGLGGAASPGFLFPGAAAAYAAEKGRGFPAYGGATVGSLAGDALAGAARGGALGRRVGSALGAAGGAYAMHGPSGKMPAYKKTASVSEISAYADLVEQGHFGKEAQYAFQGMKDAIETYVEEDLTEKTASVAETDYTIYDENAARVARLDTLLRKL